MATTKRLQKLLAITAARQNHAGNLIAKAMFARQERQFVTDSKGRQVRVFTTDAPCGKDEVRELLMNVRVVTEDEALAVIGKGAMDYMVKAGQLRKGEYKQLWVTKACAAAYDLPAYLGPRTFI